VGFVGPGCGPVTVLVPWHDYQTDVFHAGTDRFFENDLEGRFFYPVAVYQGLQR
jgi:hypothetical protein